MKPFVLAVCAMLTACSPAPPKGAAQAMPAIQAEELARFQALVDNGYIAPFRAGDVDRWLLIFDDDVVGLHNYLPAMNGKEGLRGFGTFVRDNLVVAEMSVRLEGLRSGGNIAYTWGRYRSRLLLKSSGEGLPGHSPDGKLLLVWKRQANGDWKIAVDMGNALQSEGAGPGQK